MGAACVLMSASVVNTGLSTNSGLHRKGAGWEPIRKNGACGLASAVEGQHSSTHGVPLAGERVTAGMVHARRQGKRIGRPKKVFDRDKVFRLRRQGHSIEKIARQMRLGVGTVVRVPQERERVEAGCQKALA